MAKARGLAEAQGFGDAVDRKLILTQHLLGSLEAQFIEQFLITAAHVLQMSAQSARRAFHLLGQTFQSRCGVQLGTEQLADTAQPGLTSGEFEVLLATAFSHGLMGDGVRQRQRLVQPVAVEGERVVFGGEVQRCIEVLGIAFAVIRCLMFKTDGKQRQRTAE